MNLLRTFALGLVVLLMTLCSFTSIAFAHSETEPLWERDPQELAQLEQTLQTHRRELIKALDQAFNEGFGAETLQRPYKFDSNLNEVEIPRSVLNRVIASSLAVEIATVEKYMFCDSCEHSLAQELKDNPDKGTILKSLRSLWPKIKGSFTLMFKDIPVGVWKRVIYASAYSRALGASLRYQSNAYGVIPMVAGIAAFSTAYGVTEVAESVYLVGLHFLCQANYFWSIAFGTAVASFSRDIKALLFFNKENLSLFERIGRAYTNYRSIKSLAKLEERVIFQTVLGDGNDKIFKEIHRRTAYSGHLLHALQDIAPLRSVAADPLLWAELVAQDNRASAAMPARSTKQKLFKQEIQRIFSTGETAYDGLYLWHDMASSLRTILRSFRLDIDTQHQIYKNRGASLSALGELDANLRALDLFMTSLLREQKRNPSTSDVEASSEWLRNVLAEVLSIGVESLEADFDKKVADVLLKNLKEIISASIKRGSPISVRPEGISHLKSVLQDHVRVNSCQALFL